MILINESSNQAIDSLESIHILEELGAIEQLTNDGLDVSSIAAPGIDPRPQGECCVGKLE